MAPVGRARSIGSAGGRMRKAGILIVVVGLAVLVALGSSRSLAGLGPSRSLPDLRFLLLDLFVLATVVSAVILGLLFYLLLGDARKRRKSELRRSAVVIPTPWWIQTLVVLLALALIGGIVAAAVLGRGTGGDVFTGPPPSLSTPLPAGTGEGPAETGSAGLTGHWWFMGVLGALAVAAIGVFLVRQRSSRPSKALALPSVQEAVRAAVDIGLTDLDDDPDPRRAVIRAYARLERILAEHGLGRKASETPVEYLARWGAALSLSRPLGEALTALYERARFSPHLIDKEMRQQAEAQFKALRRELEIERT